MSKGSPRSLEHRPSSKLPPHPATVAGSGTRHAATTVQPKRPHPAKLGAPTRGASTATVRSAAGIQRMEDPKPGILAKYVKSADLRTKPDWAVLKELGINEAVKDHWRTLGNFYDAVKATAEWRAVNAQEQERSRRQEQGRLEEEAEAEKKAARSRPRRRLESLARLLETINNVCVAITLIDGRIYACTNQGRIAAVKFEDGALWVEDLSVNEPGERTRVRDAAKVHASVGELIPAEVLNEIRQVGDELGHHVHAEMKLLDYCASVLKLKNCTVYFRISRLCCFYCRAAIDVWNANSATKLEVIAFGSHGNEYPGWYPPPCIRADKKVEDALMIALGIRNWRHIEGGGKQDNPRTRSDRSPSPPPRDRSLKDWTG